MKMDGLQDKPLMIQHDFTVLLEVNHPRFEQVRSELSAFADLIKSPAHLHTYRITPLSLWNAAASGVQAEGILRFLQQYSKFDMPGSIRKHIIEYIRRYGLLRLELQGSNMHLISKDTEVIRNILNFPSLSGFELAFINPSTIQIQPQHRGQIKQELIHLGYPVEDAVGYHHGESLAIETRKVTSEGLSFSLRDYQTSAVDAFYQNGNVYGGSGVLVLPCGSGKTVIGIAAMARLGCATLILTTNVTSVKQWKREILEKTTITEDLVGEYAGTRREVKPITIATYQILTHRKSKNSDFKHMKLFNERDWGFIIYDEVHLLPAPVFRVTADIQATRRLGLTATLVREDQREADVFSLVGPKRFDIPWRELEQRGWIASVKCTEIRVPLSESAREKYMQTEPRDKHRLAGENPRKMDIVKQLLRDHQNMPTLVIGQYLEQLHLLSETLKAPLITGQTPYEERERLYHKFKQGTISLLIVSKVANFAVDLPDAAVAIQVSGSFGSRQEEAQRLGRILRPKKEANYAYFYSLVSGDTREQEFAANRQLFLVEQGYEYHIKEAESMPIRERMI
jgi:DNA excision repair protein ERCC-3